MPKITINLSEFEAQRFSAQLQEHAEDLAWLSEVFHNVAQQVCEQIDTEETDHGG